MAEAAAKPIPPRPPRASESKPIIGGRLWIAIAVLLGFGLLANPKFNNVIIQRFAPPADVHNDLAAWKVGGESNVRVTVVTADEGRLACAQAKVEDGTHCAFGSDHVPWAKTVDTPLDDNGASLIQPYRTSPDNALILLSGLWAQPEVAMRLHREPPTGVEAKRLQRFDVTCRVKFLDKLPKVDVRWDVTGKWQTERNAWVARAESCTVNKG